MSQLEKVIKCKFSKCVFFSFQAQESIFDIMGGHYSQNQVRVAFSHQVYIVNEWVKDVEIQVP